LLMVYNPQAIVIGGGVAQSALLLDLVRSGLTGIRTQFPGRMTGAAILPAQFGSQAGAVGAALWAREQSGSG